MEKHRYFEIIQLHYESRLCFCSDVINIYNNFAQNILNKFDLIVGTFKIIKNLNTQINNIL